MQLDFEQAAEFLRVLDPNATAFQWQLFADRKGAAVRPRTWFASLADAWPEIQAAQAEGAGVFVTVNETDGNGRKASNLKRIRAVWHDDDGPGFNPQAGDGELLPNLAVRTSAGRMQRIWLVDGMTPEQHAEAMRAMVARGSDKNATDVVRVLRLPGTYHQKGEPQLVTLLRGEMLGGGWGNYTPRDVARAYPAPVISAPVPAERTAAPSSEVTEAFKALAHIPPTGERSEWLHVGMMLHGLGDAGFQLWDTWSQLGEGYNAEDQERVWKSIKDDKANIATLATLFKYAAKHGYNAPGTSEAEIMSAFGPVEVMGEAPAATPAPSMTADALLKFPAELTLAGLKERRASAIVEDLIFPEQYAIVYGASTAGKTFVALDMAMHIALGRDWHGLRVKCVPVLYVPLEGRGGFEIRVMAAIERFGHPGKFFAMLRPDVKLTKDDDGAIGAASIIAACKVLEAQCGAKVGLVVIDTQARAMAGDNEDSTQEMGTFIDRAKLIQSETGACVMNVHHTNKSGSMRGNAVNEGAADLIIRVSRPMDEKKRTPIEGPREVFLQKAKDGEDGRTLFLFELDDVELREPGSDEVVVTSKVVAVVTSPNLEKPAGENNHSPESDFNE